jgi:hypothetical protein
VLADEPLEGRALFGLGVHPELVEDAADDLDVLPRLEQMSVEPVAEVGRVRALQQLREHLVGERQLDPEHLPQPGGEEVTRTRDRLGHVDRRARARGSYTPGTGVPRGSG